MCFEKDTYIREFLRVNTNYDEEIKLGDTVFLTSSSFPYDNSLGIFDNEAEIKYSATVRITEVDLSEYDDRRCITGGCYAFAVGEVVDIRDFE